MTQTQKNITLFEEHLKDYEQWFKDHPAILDSEVEAFRELLPEGDLHGIEIGSGTGHIALALGLKEGVEPSEKLRSISVERGLEAIAGKAEELPFKDLHFDFVILSTALQYLENVDKAFSEAYRVLKPKGNFLLGFLDPESIIAKEYYTRKKQSTFYRHAHFYSLKTIIQKLKDNGFRSTSLHQTLFGASNEIKEKQHMLPGIGLGSFILINATKNTSL
jgi:ubiquinone/menaquinone biosynthesis C-methylase UbiE